MPVCMYLPILFHQQAMLYTEVLLPFSFAVEINLHGMHEHLRYCFQKIKKRKEKKSKLTPVMSALC